MVAGNKQVFYQGSIANPRRSRGFVKHRDKIRVHLAVTIRCFIRVSVSSFDEFKMQKLYKKLNYFRVDRFNVNSQSV